MTRKWQGFLLGLFFVASPVAVAFFTYCVKFSPNTLLKECNFAVENKIKLLLTIKTEDMKSFLKSIPGWLLMTAMVMLSHPAVADQREKTPAFPGAEGSGRYVTGGRGGQVYHVKNLNDSGYGSLRWACSQAGARTIVFDVSGTIHLQSSLKLTNGNVTIAGQTAPGDGICVADGDFIISAPNVIIRYMRFRPGDTLGGEPDGLGGFDGKNIIIDHCSISWSVDECCSVYGNEHMTVQWCVIAQSLRNSTHAKEAHGYGGNWGGKGATYHHNLLAHHDSRVPRLGNRPMYAGKDTTDFRNNVYYNWGGNGCYGGEGMKANIVNCYYKPGPGTDVRANGNSAIKYRIAGIGITTDPSNAMYNIWGKFFVDGNVNPDNNGVTANNWSRGVWQQITQNKPNDDAQDTIRLMAPLPFMHVTTHTAQQAYEQVLKYAGASLHRDAVDELVISDTQNRKASYTGKKTNDNIPGIIDTPTDIRPADAPANWSPWPTLTSGTAPTDTDGDGMPDEWETANGLDPENSADGNVVDDEGYTNLEHYLNSLVAHITEAQNEGGTVEGFDEYLAAAKDEYVISTDTKEDSGWSFGNDITLTNNGGGNYGTSGSYIRIPRDQQHTLTLPVGVTIKRVKFEGKGRYSTESYSDASLTELNGQTFAEGTYALPKGEASEFTVQLATPAKNTLTFTFTGNNADCVITLCTTDNTSGVTTVRAENFTTDNGWYTMQGLRVAAPTAKGIYIHEGKKIIVKD